LLFFEDFLSNILFLIYENNIKTLKINNLKIRKETASSLMNYISMAWVVGGGTAWRLLMIEVNSRALSILAPVPALESLSLQIYSRIAVPPIICIWKEKGRRHFVWRHIIFTHPRQNTHDKKKKLGIRACEDLLQEARHQKDI